MFKRFLSWLFSAPLAVATLNVDVDCCYEADCNCPCNVDYGNSDENKPD